MTGFHKNQRAVLLRIRVVLALMRVSNPASCRVGAVLIMEGSTQHEDFFTTPVRVWFEQRSGLPAHQGHLLGPE